MTEDKFRIRRERIELGQGFLRVDLAALKILPFAKYRTDGKDSTTFRELYIKQQTTVEKLINIHSTVYCSIMVLLAQLPYSESRY